MKTKTRTRTMEQIRRHHQRLLREAGAPTLRSLKAQQRHEDKDWTALNAAAEAEAKRLGLA